MFKIKAKCVFLYFEAVPFVLHRAVMQSQIPPAQKNSICLTKKHSSLLCLG